MFTTLRRWLRAWAAPAMFSFLAACGGGGGDGGNQTVAPTITTPPAAATATEGETATFTVAASGTAPLAYQWQRNGTAIAGATAASYTTPALALADSGALYSVVVSNAAGSVTSGTALLTALAAPPPSIVAQPAATSVVAPATATFSVSAQGLSLAYQWTRNGAPIAGATAASYTTPATVLADSGALFAVVVSNPRGDVTSDEAQLTVTTAAQAPAIATEPAGVTVDSGDTATFSVVATGTAPLAYQWRRNGIAITGATGASYTTPATVDGDNGAAFSVVIDNVTAMPITSTAATLSVIASITPPSITAQPAGQSVIVGQTATFTVAANGTPPLAYQWRRNGTAITGATAASYTTLSTVIGDNGARFSVVVSNASATAATSADATLSVTTAVEPPSIIAQPADATVSVGASATFTAGATGSAPLAYQWRRNSVAIAGATAASWTIASATLADHNALFDVVVSNAAPTSATSNAARLTVLDQWVGIREDGATRANGAGAHDVGRSVASDRNGNVIIAGLTNGTFVPPGATVLGTVFIAKYSASGVRTWVRDVIVNDGGSIPDSADHASVAVDGAGNIYVGGTTTGTWTGQTRIGVQDAYVAKYNPDGNLLWARQFGSTSADLVTGIAVDAQGNAFVVGHSTGQMPDQTTVHQGQDFFIAKFDTGGNRQWIRQSGTASAGATDLGQAVAVDGAGNAYMTGRLAGDYAGSPGRNLASDAYVIKYDASGNRVWFSRIAGEQTDAGNGIAVSADGATIYVVGQTNSNFDLPGYPTMDTFSQEGAFVVKLDGNGAIVWAHNLPPGPTDGQQFTHEAHGVATDAAGSVAFVTGHTLGVMPGETTKGARDIWVARFAGDGTRDWVRQLGGGEPTQASVINDAGWGITRDRNGDVFVVGDSTGTFGTPNPDTAFTDWFVMKLRAADGSTY